MIAVDTSVVVAAFATWHELHEAARATVDRGARLPAHVALETYSVLTRLPAPHRAPAGVARDFLSDRFSKPYLTMEAGRYESFVDGLPSRGIAGAAVYDALIATIAVDAGATLVSCDRRAAPTYERCDAVVEYLT